MSSVVWLFVVLLWYERHGTLSAHGRTKTSTSPNELGEPVTEQTEVPPDHRFFLQEIFKKYGQDSQMTFEGFEHLLESLGLGNVFIDDHDVEAHKERYFQNQHESHQHSKERTNAPSKRGERDSTKNIKIDISVPLEEWRRNKTKGHDVHSHHDHDHHDEHVESSTITTPTQQHTTEETRISVNVLNRIQDGNRNQIPELSENITYILDTHGERRIQETDKSISTHQQQCLSPKEILFMFNIDPKSNLNPISFVHLCPAIIYELDQQHCNFYGQRAFQEDSEIDNMYQWLYATLAVFGISVCGIICVGLIPLMRKWFFQTLLQFLVALAIGSLAGDALLHLMPHTMTHNGGDNQSEEHEHDSKDASHNTAVWYGLTCLGGIFFFFIAEKTLNAFNIYRRKRQLKQVSTPSRASNPAINSDAGDQNNIGEKLSHYRKSSYGLKIGPDGKESMQMLPDPDKDITSRRDSKQSVHEVGFHGRSSFSADPISGTLCLPPDSSNVSDGYVVTITEHHGHGHGHSHEIPQSVTAVAWMVIMGDGLHNFCDGIAIGAAFAESIAGGMSTTVAVLCHELPHELGDFAMLLKTGMKVKQAMFYNVVSSILCFLGMILGLCLGKYGTNWFFAAIAGMFLYIALVDMLPELSTSVTDSESTAIFSLAIQVLGISFGLGIMLVIAIYEHDLVEKLS